MTFKRDYNKLLLHLLRELVKNALHFEEIVNGTSSSFITQIDIKVEELQNKVIEPLNSPILIMWSLGL